MNYIITSSSESKAPIRGFGAFKGESPSRLISTNDSTLLVGVGVSSTGAAGVASEGADDDEDAAPSMTAVVLGEGALWSAGA